MSESPLPPTSRYAAVGTARLDLAGGRTVVYLRRRFIPQPEHYAQLEEHTVAQGERLDNIAAARLGDPERFWLLCDANRAMRPDELTEELGRRLRVTLPAGIPGPGVGGGA